MAGFMIFVGSGGSDSQAWSNLTTIAGSGVYAARLNPPRLRWRDSQEGTFADYATVREGDFVFFFSKRKIYGVGRIVPVSGASAFVNFPGGSEPQEVAYEDVRDQLLWDEGQESVNQRWLCTFRGDPAIFENGVDIDDVLASDPGAFKALRAMQSVTFARVDDREAQSLRNVILRANTQWLSDGNVTGGFFEDASSHHHARIASAATSEHQLDPSPLLLACAEDDVLRHEMALEAGLVWQLANQEPAAAQVFGKWDYVTHQVLASPFKPLDWADKMDIFGYSYLEGFHPTMSRFLVIETKKGPATIEVVDQVMKYVDWIRDEYAGGDYLAIHAFVVAHSFPDQVIARAREGGRRIHTIGRRPAVIQEWSHLGLVQYRFRRSSGRLDFTNVPIPPIPA